MNNALYYAVAPLLEIKDGWSYRYKNGEFQWVTMFYVFGEGKVSEPSGLMCDLDTLHFSFKPLKKSEYETHIAFGSLEYRDSDNFAMFHQNDERDQHRY